jgi:hypothetical protein
MLSSSCTLGKAERFPLSGQAQSAGASAHLLSHGLNLCAFAALREIFLSLVAGLMGFHDAPSRFEGKMIAN